MIIGGGATDPSDIGDILREMVHSASLEPFRSMTGAEFVQGALGNMKVYKPAEFVIQDYMDSYAGERFLDSVGFVRHYPQALPRIVARLPEIDIPCQIIVGRHDPYVPVSNAQGLHRGLPRSRLDILDCGHFAWEDAAVEYGRLASQWLRGGFAAI